MNTVVKLAPLWSFVPLLILAGCSKPKPIILKQAPPPKLDPDWKTHESKSGFSLASPSNWTLNVDAMTMAQLNMQGLSQVSAPTSDSSPIKITEPPDEVTPEDAQRQDQDGILLELYNKNVRPIPGEAMTRMFVKKEKFGGTLQDMAKSVKDDLNAQETKMVQLPIGPAAEITANRTTRGGDIVTDVIYVIDTGPQAYRFTFETTNHEGPIETEAPPIMETLRVKG